MSWFGGGLSSITSQISSFTKEVLTETTEEIQDPTAELHVARRKVSELDELNKKLQSEWEKLNRRNEEVIERAETAELQIATISQEYRKIIQEKENELRRLKTENETLREEQRRVVSRDSYHHGVPTSEQFLFTSRDDLNSQDIQDVSDMITSQSEINRLQAELATVKRECLHWKEAAQERSGNTEDSLPQLKRRIEELQSSLLQETERSQQQLSALQSLHANRLQSLVQKHREEITRLQDQLNGMTSAAVGSQQEEEEGEEESASELRRELEALRLQIQRLQAGPSEELSRGEAGEKGAEAQGPHRHCANLESVNTMLESQLEREKEANAQLQIEVESLKHQLTEEKNVLIGMLEHEKRLLADRLASMQASILDQQASTAHLQTDHHNLQQEVESLQQMTRRLVQELREKEEEIAVLRRCGGGVRSGTQDEGVGEALSSVTSSPVKGMAVTLSDNNPGTKPIAPSDKEPVTPSNKGTPSNTGPVSPHRGPSNTGSLHQPLPLGSGAVLPASLCEDLESTIQSLREAIQVERTQRETLAAHLVQLTSDHDHELSLLLEEKESLLGEATSLREDLDRTGVWREQTLTESAALKMENVGLQGEVARLQGEVAMLKETVSELERGSQAIGSEMAVSVANQQVFPEGVEELGIAEPGGGPRGQGVCAVVVKRGEQAMGELIRVKDKEISDLQEWEEQERERHPMEKEVYMGEAMLLGAKSHTQTMARVYADSVPGAEHGSHSIAVTLSNTGEDAQLTVRRGEGGVGGLRTGGVQAVHACGEGLVGSDGLTRELEQLQSKMESLQLERSQLLSDLQVQKDVVRVCESKLEARDLECAKYAREVERLKPHLIELQDQFAQEALRYQQEEAEMKRYVKGLEDQMKVAGSSEVVYSQQLQAQLRNLEQQLRVLTGQRDDALSRLARVSEEAEQNAKAVSNLQSALDLFQQEQASELNAALRHLQSGLAEALKECDARSKELESTKLELQEVTLAAGNAVGLKEEVAKKDGTIAQLLARVSSLQACLDETQVQLIKLSRDSSTKLDRGLVKNMVVQCIHAGSHGKRQEVVRLIARILEVAPEELDPSLGKGSGWLTGLWSKPLPPSPIPSSPVVGGRGSSLPSLSQLFVHFLEAESAGSRQAAATPPSSSPSYIDPKTDPDRPSRATAATLAGSHTLFFSPPQTVPPAVAPLTSSDSPLPRLQSARTSLTGQNIVSPSPSQSAVLKSILSTSVP